MQAGIDTARGSLSRSDDAFNIGDIHLTPLILGWNAGDFHWNVALSVVTPSGQYSRGALANPSLNYWSAVPQSALTYLDPKTGFEVSAAVAYAVNTEDVTTNYRTGNVFHLDWAVGQYLSPAGKVGVVGYLMEQVTGVSGSGAILGPNKAAIWALGPAAVYNLAIGKTPVSIVAKWTHEIEASHTFQGDTVTVAISFKC